MTQPRSAQARAAVPWARISIGFVAQFAPRLVYAAAAIRPGDNDDAEFIIRAFGARAIALGAISTGFAGEAAARQAMQMGAVMDLVDIRTVWRCYRDGKLGTTPLVVNAVGGLLFAVLGVVGSTHTRA